MNNNFCYFYLDKKIKTELLDLSSYTDATFSMAKINDIDTIIGPQNHIKFNLVDLENNIDLSNTKSATFHFCTTTNLKTLQFPQDSITYSDMRRFEDHVDFSSLNNAELESCSSLKTKSIKGPKNNFTYVNNQLGPELIDLSETQKANFSRSQFYYIKTIKAPKNSISFTDSYGFSMRTLDLTPTKNAYISNCDFSDIYCLKGAKDKTSLFSMKLMPKIIDLSQCSASEGNWNNFSNCAMIILPPLNKYNHENHKWIEQVKKENPKINIKHADQTFLQAMGITKFKDILFGRCNE